MDYNTLIEQVCALVKEALTQLPVESNESIKENIKEEKEKYKDSYIIRELSNTNLFKIANGICDDEITTSAVKAILSGKHVVIVKEGIELLFYKNSAPKPFFDNLNKNLELLLSSGVELVDESDIPSCNIECNKEIVSNIAEKEVVVCKEKEEKAVELKKRAVTERDIREARTGGYNIIYIMQNTIVTGLAEETARNYNIKIVRQ